MKLIGHIGEKPLNSKGLKRRKANAPIAAGRRREMWVGGVSCVKALTKR